MDELKKVYVIVGVGYTVDKVKKEIKEEGYSYEFHFGCLFELLKESDEVWLFGDCSDREDFALAKELGCDIWDMTA